MPIVKQALIVWVLLLCAGCARHVVVEPEQVSGFNDTDWVVKSAPRSQEHQEK